MIFKNTSILFGAALTALVLVSSCEGNKKKEEQMRIETERVERESAEKARMEMEAEEARLKEEARANSIAGQAMKNEDLTTLVSALQSADLAAMLSEPGEYTVFAPSNQAFEKLTQKQRDELMKPENKQMLTDVLTYHVVKGAITSDKFAEAIKGAKGSYKFKTVKGDELIASMSGDQFVIKDATGKKAQVILGNVEASNGRIYIIDTVLMFKN